ncbi:hypothetical protein JOQ06_011205 [Pogonophryne albipinna]|uniref:Uncharacterized protein n=1 Tax=Pogonophryne albipinna TaxID=1090488 RepID=A0AAD6F3P5_9TELE|nr:hypothetical protein JOQ06_011205 [Pogonophryne albipinna]
MSLPLRYSATELLRLRSYSRTPPALLAQHSTILKRPRYIHRGSGRNFEYTKHSNNKTIRSFWSTEPRPPRTARAVNHKDTSDWSTEDGSDWSTEDASDWSTEDASDWSTEDASDWSTEDASDWSTEDASDWSTEDASD